MAASLLDHLHELGFQVGVEEGRLWVSPKDRLTPVLRDRLQANKTTLIALLQKEEGGAPFQANVLVRDDCSNVLKRLPGNSVDLVVTDPPYGYGFMGKQWDKALPNPEIWNGSSLKAQQVCTGPTFRF